MEGDVNDTNLSHVTEVGILKSDDNSDKDDDVEGDDDVYEQAPGTLIYGIAEVPPFAIILSIALQNILLGLGVALSTAYVIADVICAEPDNPIRAKLFCTSLFMTGICTILQPIIGVRLPIFQGVCSTFLVPLVAMKNYDGWKCEDSSQLVSNSSVSNATGSNNASGMDFDKDADMYRRLREILLSVLVTWLICGIMTAVGGFTDDPAALQYCARTDYRAGVIDNTPWLYVPYPGQFGSPLFNTTVFIGFLSAVISSIRESIGDYYAAAGMSHTPVPPTHAVNRGILLEGLSSVLSGAMGAGHATTSSTGHVALIGISQVASRSCLIFSGLLCLVFSVVGKLGAVLSTMPEPAVGGAMFVIFGILGSIGIFTLRSVDMTSSRNLAVFGLSLYAGIVIPEWVERYPENIDTGTITTDGIVQGILGTPMFLGGFVAVILDNTVRGILKERGFVQRDAAYSDVSREQGRVSGTVYKYHTPLRVI